MTDTGEQQPTIDLDPGPDPVAGGAGAATLPEAAERRLRSPAFSSALSVNEFAACLDMDMQPVGMVQGFCVMSWRWSNYYGMGGMATGPRYRTAGTRTLEQYSCPHPYQMSAEHRSWGSNDELTTMEDYWEWGFATAHGRLVAEAAELGASGVIGILDTSHSLIDSGIFEFHLTGTAVVVAGRRGLNRGLFTTFLAGQRLAKLLEAGLVPVSVVASMSAVSIWPVCVTEYRESGRMDPAGMVNPEGEIRQIADADMAVRRVARDRIHHQIGSDSLHGARLNIHAGHVAAQTTLFGHLRGTRVRRVHDVDPLPTPTPTVRLS